MGGVRAALVFTALVTLVCGNALADSFALRTVQSGDSVGSIANRFGVSSS